MQKTAAVKKPKRLPRQVAGTAVEEEEQQARLEATRQRVRELQGHPAVVAALQEYEESDAQITEEAAELFRRMEAGELRREAMVRRYGQSFVDSLEYPGGE